MFFSGITVKAQNGINDPYSQYGIGSGNIPFNMPVFTALGGSVLTYSSTNAINPFNPASYATIASESFVFDMGLNIQNTKLSNKNGEMSDGDGNLGYIAVGFPIARWWKTSLSMMPLGDLSYSSVYTEVAEPWGVAKTSYEGTGGVTMFTWGHAFNIMGGTDSKKPQLRAGFNINYLYGPLTRAITYSFPDNDTSYYMNSRRQKDTHIKNFTYDIGVQYERPFGGDYRFVVGLNIKPKRSMSVKDKSMVYTYVTYATQEYMRDTIFPANGEDPEYNSELVQPFTTGIGFSIQRDNRWRVALDATFASSSGIKYIENTDYNIFGKSPLRYGSNSRYAFGMQLLGDKNSSSYLRRITVSAGAHYEYGKLRLNIDNENHCLNEWGVGLGFSLPMRKGRSAVNITVAYSSLGTTDLLRNEVFTFGISLGSCESWFVKRKFN